MTYAENWPTVQLISQLEGSTACISASTKISEYKATITIDDLIYKHGFRVPTVIKMDVDGVEPWILMGMERLLSDSAKPRTIQIEVDPSQRDQVKQIMARNGYDVTGTNYTRYGQILIDEGQDPENYPYNIIFEPN